MVVGETVEENRKLPVFISTGYIIYKTTYCRPTKVLQEKNGNDAANGHRTGAAFKYREELAHNDSHSPACLLVKHTNRPRQ